MLDVKKSQAAYEHLFDFINTNVFKLSTVASFTTDYEVAMRNALRKINPTAKIYACHFHYCQALKRKASQIVGLVKLFRSRNGAKAQTIYYRLQCLPLLPAVHIKDAFDVLKKEALEIKHPALNAFMLYFEKQ